MLQKKRIGYVFNVEDYSATITILRPFSGEHLQFGRYLVLYENAHGEISVNSMSFDEIGEKYSIDQRDLDGIF